MRASELNWQEIPNFSPGEWPAGVLEQMDARVIQVLAAVRQRLPRTHRMDPSPVPGAHVRATGTSRHSTQGGRLSDATDFFMDWQHAWDALIALQAEPRIGGLGIYTDMMWSGREGDRCMFHIDTRPERVEWVAWRVSRDTPTVYVNKARDPLEYHRIIASRGQQR